MRADTATLHALTGHSSMTKMQKVVIPVRTSSWNQTTAQEDDLWTPGKYNFGEIPTLHHGRQSKHHSKRQSTRSTRPSWTSTRRSYFDYLPSEIYHSILEHIVNSRVNGLEVAVSSLLRDLLSCSLVSKRWYLAAREHIYGHLWLLENGVPKRRKRLSLTRAKGRLDLLVRTLTEKPQLARRIYAAHVTPALRAELVAPKTLFTKSSPVLDLVRDVIDRCPNLEQITGFLPALDPHFATYFQTLLRRPQLRTLAWWTSQPEWYIVDFQRLSEYERCWHTLETLVLSQGNLMKSFGLSHEAIGSLILSLPRLQRLMLSGLSKEEINDDTLARLPPLSSLRLDRLPGVTDAGIVALVASGHASSLRSLTFHGLELVKMTTVRTVLDGCPQLLRLRVEQTRSFEATAVADDTQLRPVLQSPTLRYLHWETLHAGDALKMIAISIKHGGLPALRTIKVPFDHEGFVQAICRPIRETALTEDDVKFLKTERLHQSSHSIRLAQLRAQQRIQHRRQQPSFNFRIADEHDNVQSEDVIGSFLGSLTSTIEYSLEPDVPDAVETLSTEGSG